MQSILFLADIRPTQRSIELRCIVSGVLVLLQIVSVVLMAIGIYIVVDRVMFVDDVVGTSMVYDAALVVTIASGLTVAISVVGCCSSRPSADRILSSTVSSCTRLPTTSTV
jgi:hypothetical protein